VVDPVALAGGMDLNEIIGMTVGDLVEHIESRLGSSARAESLQSPAEV
jgi:hypothetical protein